MSTKISVLGAGAMGTGCAVVLADHPGQTVSIWARNADFAREIQESRCNQRLLPGIELSDSIDVTSDIHQALDGADYLLLAIPSAFLRQALTSNSEAFTSDLPVISVIKGIENGTFFRPSEIVADVLGTTSVVALCGPSHAEEFARRQPASVVAASTDEALSKQVQAMFNTDRFRVYTHTDIVGAELAGALKNVIALAAGICDGLEYGDNAKSALITRGLAEMTRFGLKMGAEPATFAGLAGMGDLITTCVSPFGRNRAVGERLGRGESLQQILDSMQAVAEGVTTTRSVHELAQQEELDLPITSEIYRVLFEDKSPKEATNSLMLRPPREE